LGNSAHVAVVGVAAPLVVGAATMRPAINAPVAIAASNSRFKCPFIPIALPCYAATEWRPFHDPQPPQRRKIP
jgi:sorbitol-specific phosphotransferase system component IIBC